MIDSKAPIGHLARVIGFNAEDCNGTIVRLLGLGDLDYLEWETQYVSDGPRIWSGQTLWFTGSHLELVPHD